MNFSKVAAFFVAYLILISNCFGFNKPTSGQIGSLRAHSFRVDCQYDGSDCHVRICVMNGSNNNCFEEIEGFKLITNRNIENELKKFDESIVKSLNNLNENLKKDVILNAVREELGKLVEDIVNKKVEEKLKELKEDEN